MQLCDTTYCKETLFSTTLPYNNFLLVTFTSFFYYDLPRVGEEAPIELLWQFLSESLGIVDNVVVEES